MRMCICKATRFEFNLNNKIRFKPTELGKIVFKAYWMPYSKDGEEHNIKIDTEGWAEMQLHEFMKIYGASFGCGMNIPVETTVILIDNLMEEKELIEIAMGRQQKDKNESD